MRKSYRFGFHISFQNDSDCNATDATIAHLTHCRRFWISQEVDFQNFPTSGMHSAPMCQISRNRKCEVELLMIQHIFVWF